MNPRTNPSTFYELQCLGHIRPDILLGRRSRDQFPFAWLLAQDSKASAFSRLLFAMKPWYALEPPQVGGVRLVSVADPLAVSRLGLEPASRRPRPPSARPAGRAGMGPQIAPILQRFWGDGLQKSSRLTVNRRTLEWAENDPDGLLAAARILASQKQDADDPGAARLLRLLLVDARGRPNTTNQELLDQLLTARPEAARRGRPDPQRPSRRRGSGHDPLRIHRSRLDRRLSRSRSSRIVAGVCHSVGPYACSPTTSSSTGVASCERARTARRLGANQAAASRAVR